MAISTLKKMREGLLLKVSPSAPRDGRKAAPQPMTNTEVMKTADRDRLLEKKFCPESLEWLRDNLGIDLTDPSYSRKGAYDPIYDISQGKFTKPVEVTVRPLVYDRKAGVKKEMAPVVACVSVRCIFPFADGRPVAPGNGRKVYVSTIPVRPQVDRETMLAVPEGAAQCKPGPDDRFGVYESDGFGVAYYRGDIAPADDVVFVFGSNVEGRHGAGAAKTARERFGAEYGVAEGMTGSSYAIPTKDLRIKENKGFRSVSKEAIGESIGKFYACAESSPEKKFLVAYRNVDKASLSGYRGTEMMELFRKAGDMPSNVYFSEEWARSGGLCPRIEFSEQEMMALESVGIDRKRLSHGEFNALSYDKCKELSEGGKVRVDGVIPTSFGQVAVIGDVSLVKEDGNVRARFDTVAPSVQTDSLAVDLEGASRQGRIGFDFFEKDGNGGWVLDDDGLRVPTEAARNLLEFGHSLVPVEGISHGKWDAEKKGFEEGEFPSKYTLAVENGNVYASPLDDSQQVKCRMDGDRVYVDGYGGKSFEFVSQKELENYRKGFGGVVRGAVFHDQKYNRDITYDAFVVADATKAGFARQFSPDSTRRILESRGEKVKKKRKVTREQRRSVEALLEKTGRGRRR